MALGALDAAHTIDSYINGQAGSGKSTMLQYLAADYIDFAIRRNTDLVPLYMTCSTDLLDRARKTVRGLLTKHHAQLYHGGHDDTTVDTISKRTFKVFHDLLYDLLPADKQDCFASARKVTYFAFRRLWETDFAKRSEARSISMDLAWHTIRSYIKGMRYSLDDELSPEEFNALPAKRRSVSPETYKQIFERVWESWYKKLCNENGYWDDQDLTAMILDANILKEQQFAAIFCDESQDFTPIELEIILQLSVFSRRSLSPEELKRVPFVFAGDPLQTVNPTGFRWDAVQANFHERFNSVLDSRRRDGVEINYEELTFNYRSNPGIVNFCNLIQLLRSVVLGDQKIKPQESWWVDAPFQPIWFDVENAQTKEQLRKQPELVKLVNCDEGGESEYVRNLDTHKVLHKIADEDQGVFRNILGPIRAKGLEFPDVVLYCFGENPPKDFGRLLTGHKRVDGDPEARLPYEYYLNRLYVAASRAKGRLIIVDSPSAINDFWRFATDTTLIDDLLTRSSNPEVWQNKIKLLMQGREEAWSGAKIDPAELAKDYESQGRSGRDPYLLRQAAQSYRSAGNEVKEGHCLALAFEFEGKLKEAGEKYQEIGRHEEAFGCFWKGKHFQDICKLTPRQPSLSSKPESRAADFMTQEGANPSAFLRTMSQGITDKEWVQNIAGDATWRYVASQLAERLAAVKEPSEILWQEAHTMAESLAAVGIPLLESKRAVIAYRAGQYEKAIELWKVCGETDTDDYHRANAKLQPFPKNLVSHKKLREHDKVLEIWLKRRETLSDLRSLGPEVAIAVIDSALSQNNLDVAVELLEEYPEPNLLEKLLLEATKANDVPRVIQAASIAARLFVRSKIWNAAVKAAEEADFSDYKKVNKNKLQKILNEGEGEGANKVFEFVLRALAVSDDLPFESSENQSMVSEFLYRHFVKPGRSKQRKYSLPVEIPGAAIERAGRIVHALQYYEDLERDGSITQKSREFAIQRQIRNLEKLADYYRSRRDGQQETRQREEKARSLRASYGLKDTELPDYPLIEKKLAAPKIQTEWQHGPFKIELYREDGRLRIHHKERHETITVFGKTHQLRGDADFSETSHSGDDTGSWEIGDWKMSIRLYKQGNMIKIHAEFDGGPFEVELGRAE